jgi:predicted glycogen debranching enzyme
MNVELPAWVRFGREICGDLAAAERREWWLANGVGGYASGTVAGTLTRRYHGLLVAPVNPPLGRMLVAAKADASYLRDGAEVPLFSNRWSGGAVSPAGHVLIESFHLDGRMPVWRYQIGDEIVEMRIWMEPGANTTYVAFRREVRAGAPHAQLRVRLLVNARDHHGSTHVGAFDPRVEGSNGKLRVEHGDRFTLHVRARGGAIASEKTWYENFDLPVERERGLHDRDNHLCVGQALLDLHAGDWSGVVFSLHEDVSPYLEEAMRRFKAHDLGLLKRARVQVPELIDAPDWVDQLVLGADSFVFARPLPDQPDGESVIAGYPWFGDWGRDTMIALPGLTLATGRYDTARRILRTFARFVDQGMLPNVFPGDGATPEYNTVDAALWFVEAWRAYFETTGDTGALREVFPVLADVIAWHQRGTRYGIGVDATDGLLGAGEPGVQLTWMDAKIGDWVVTPRTGKPVEINALWFNALCAMAELASRVNADPAPYRAAAERVRSSFARFANPANGGLFDVIDGPQGNDPTVRPNQVFAVSLPHSPLDADAQRRIVELCGAQLFTSYGLRSLPPSDPQYRPQYTGGVWDRDSGYHQGPVWAWLLAHFALAEARAFDDPATAQSRLAPLRDHLMDAGLGTVSEIFDADEPHAPRGAPSQAWSVACALEAWSRLERTRRLRQSLPQEPVPQRRAS